MKKKVLVDLITSHYENDPIIFFNTTLEILKEFKMTGDEELVKHIQNRIIPHIEIVSKRYADNYKREMTKEEFESIIYFNPLERR